MKRGTILAILMSIIFLVIVSAIDFIPQGNINLKGIFNITNLAYVSNFSLSGNINARQNNITNINVLNATTISGEGSGIFGINNVNSSTWWANVSSFAVFYLYKNGNILDLDETKLNRTIIIQGVIYNDTVLINAVNTTNNIRGLGFYTKSEVDNNMTFYLLLTDQRFNDTNFIKLVNTTTNIQGLGFYTKAQVDSNLSYYLLLTDQRFNETAWANATFLKIADMFAKSEITGMISGNRTAIETNTNSAISGNVSNLNSAITNNVSQLNTNIQGNWTDLNNSKLDKTDQRFNGTVLINSVNSSLDSKINAINSSTYNWAETTFLKIVNMFSKSEIVSMISGNRTEIENEISGNVSALRTDIINNATSIRNDLNGALSANVSNLNSAITNNISQVNTNIQNNWTDLNNSKLDKTDQRYNETTYVNNNFINNTREGLLNVNSSSWWASVSGWTSGWFKKTGNNLDFNSSKLATVYYNATINYTVRGTPAGKIEFLQVYDNVPYNVSEVSGANGMDFRINFTGVNSFNQIKIRYKSTIGESHKMNLQIYDTVLGNWENYFTFGEVSEYQNLGFTVDDTSDHIIEGIVQVRFYQSENGNANHIHYFDWVTIADGYATPSGAEIDPYWKGEKIGYYNKSDANSLFLYLNGTNADKNIDINSYNVTSTGSVLFTFLGSLGSKITKLFVTDINIFGSINMSSASGKVCYDTSCVHFSNATGSYWNSGSVYVYYNGSNLIMQG